MTDDFKSEFIFELTQELGYQQGGEHLTTKTLILKAPSNKVRRQCANLKQGFFRAINSLSKGSEGSKEDGKEKDEGSIDGKAVLTAIMASDVSLADYQEDFKSMLLGGVCWIVDDIKMTDPIFNEMLDMETERLMGEYITNFLLTSWMEKLS